MKRKVEKFVQGKAAEVKEGGKEGGTEGLWGKGGLLADCNIEEILPALRYKYEPRTLPLSRSAPPGPLITDGKPILLSSYSSSSAAVATAAAATAAAATAAAAAAAATAAAAAADTAVAAATGGRTLIQSTRLQA